ncbi:uncharacterized protein LOC117282245 [Cryptotermes secundus]|uniref:uncharacterized protein LOC117282245 n=1 Tax=Cryptotermes secundus TaxID=105785 RepID=UPI001454E1FC|nr:uncharacterized protein LOC117282245 [Cryptotermes secundus]
MTEPNKQCGEDEESRNEVDDKSTASGLSAVTPLPATLKRPPVKDPANRLEGGLKIQKMVHVPPSNKKKNGAMRKCHMCAKPKIRKETRWCGSLQTFMFQCLSHEEKLLKSSRPKDTSLRITCSCQQSS